MITRSLEGNWLRLQPHIDKLKRGDTLSDAQCKKACGKPLKNMLKRIKGFLMREKGIYCCIRDKKLRLMTDAEQAYVLPKAVKHTRLKLKRSICAHSTVNVAALPPEDQRRHEYYAAKATFLIGAHKEVGPDRLLASAEASTRSRSSK
jgi:hypothetical protein